MKLLIRDAIIVDGATSDRFLGSVYVEQGIIQKILPGNFGSRTEDYNYEKKAQKILDGRGYICAPGFIDTHSHSDLKVLSEPLLLPKLMQGVTTEVLGQDGISMAPLPLDCIDSWKKNLAGLDGEDDELDWSYQNVKGYLERIEAAQPALNEGYLLPHGNARMEAMGLSGRPATPEEITRMCEITRREMEAGCIGLSSGLIYIPCAYSLTEELIELCRVVKEFNGVFVVHQRSEADDILSSMDEIIRIGMESGVDIHFSHFKVCGKNNWDKLPDMLQKLDDAKAAGLNVSFDQYPYVAGSTMLGVILPPWAHDGGTDCLLGRLSDPGQRQRMRYDIEHGIEGWDNFIDFAGLEGIFITSAGSDKNQDLIGKNLKEIGHLRGKDPLEATFDLLLEEKNAVGMVDFYGTEEHVKTLIQRPEMNLCSDGLLSGKPHPRVYGSFPRLIGKYSREEQVLSLEMAVHKMTQKAALSMHLEGIGIIREGYAADMVLFDYQTIEDRGTYTEPEQYPAGIHTVIVNGEIAVENQKPTGVRSGKVIRAVRTGKMEE